MSEALKLLHKLADAGLVVSEEYDEDYGPIGNSNGKGRNRGRYNSLMWQCWQTYDSIDREEAEALFFESFDLIDPDAKEVK